MMGVDGLPPACTEVHADHAACRHRALDLVVFAYRPVGRDAHGTITVYSYDPKAAALVLNAKT